MKVIACGAWYYLNDKLEYDTISHILHNIKASVRNKEAKYVEHKFGEDGKMKWQIYFRMNIYNIFLVS